MRWRTLNEQKIPDLRAFIKEAAAKGQNVHIGTDSLQTGRFTQFVTVVAVLTPHKGGRAAYSREVVPRIKSLRERLLKETWRSVELGIALHEVVPGELTIHVDANSNLRYASSAYVQELVGMVVSNGFKSLIKPDSWAATHCADHIVRHLGKLPQHAKAC
jgi:predicted RNase H-related nuclease YkuK (DUF458 family)